jgi:Ca-activated chloride channel family protein
MYEQAIEIQARLSHNLIRPGKQGMVWVVFELKTGTARARVGQERLPLNLALVLDRSGSMSGEPLEFVKQASRFVVQQMAPKDHLSLVTFCDEVEVPCPSQPVVNKDILKSLIDSITSGGATNLSGGLLRGYQEAGKCPKSESSQAQVNRVILLTDGAANVGITSPEVLTAKVQSMAEKGVSVSTVGVGAGFNEDLLTALSDAGRGNFYYVKNPDEIPKVFAQELQGLLSIVAQGIRVKLETPGLCNLACVLGYEPVTEDGGVTLHLPDMFENETKVMVVGIENPDFDVGVHDIVTISGEYADALGDLDSVQFRVNVKIPVQEGSAEEHRPVIDVLKIVELTRTAVAKDQVVDAMDRGDYEGGKAVLEERLSALEKLAEAFGGQNARLTMKLAGSEPKLIVFRRCRMIRYFVINRRWARHS